MKFDAKPTTAAKPTASNPHGLSAAPARRPAGEAKAQAEVNLAAFAQQEEPLEEDFQRIPFGNFNSQLSASTIPGYHLHWINDWHPQMPDRLNQALRAGYRFVAPEEVDTYPATNGGNPNADLGESRVSRIVGTRPDNQPITSYLMKIPEAWWMEHQKPIADRADQVDKAIKRGAVSGPVEQGYVPKDSPIRMRQELSQRKPTEGDVNG